MTVAVAAAPKLHNMNDAAPAGVSRCAVAGFAL
jgi:hypothetical protein